ncbi:MAG: glycosyltransferase family 39 protein [Nitrospirae bacterium]|nr:glycosyltransferase family 39 protein [Nitrospirota bacterium]
MVEKTPMRVSLDISAPVQVGYFILLSLLTLAAFLTLFLFRSLDDNRLTSWLWVFADSDLVPLLLLLALGIACAIVLARAEAPERHPAGFLFLTSFAVGALFWREPEVIVDAARYFTQAKYVELYGVGYFLHEWGREIWAWTDLPLIPFLQGLLFSLAGEHRAAVQVLNTLWFAGAVALTYGIGKTLWDRTVGFLAGLLLLGMPYLLTQVPLMLVDIPTMFFLTLAVFATIKAIRQGGAGWFALASAAAALTCLTKYSAWLLLSVLVVIVLAHLPPHPRATLSRAAGVAVPAALLLGAVLLWKQDVFAEQIGLLGSYQAPGLQRWEESLASTFFFQIHPLITVAAAGSLYAAFARRDWSYAIIGWLVLLVLVLEIKRIRYLIPVFPMLALMAAYGIREIRQPAVRRGIAYCAVLASLVVALYGYLPFLQKTSAVNLKAAGEFLNTLEIDRVEVFTLPPAGGELHPGVTVPLLDLYSTKKVVYRKEADLTPRQEEIERSPLRFTWEFRQPKYYQPATEAGVGPAPMAIGVVFSERDPILPDTLEQRLRGYRLAQEFGVADPIFGYQSLVRVYLPTKTQSRPEGRV